MRSSPRPRARIAWAFGLALASILAGCLKAPPTDAAAAPEGPGSPAVADAAPASPSEAAPTPWRLPAADRRAPPPSPHPTMADPGFESDDGWTLAGGAQRDCALAGEGRCSLRLPSSGGAASQAFLAHDSLELNYRGRMADPESPVRLVVGIQAFDADGRSLGSGITAMELTLWHEWSQLGVSHSAMGMRQVVVTFAVEGGATQDLWIDDLGFGPLPRGDQSR